MIPETTSIQAAYHSSKGQGGVIIKGVVIGLKSVHELDQLSYLVSSLVVFSLASKQMQSQHTHGLNTVDVLTQTSASQKQENFTPQSGFCPQYK